jgi:membrane-associated phospholipid phosphatase
VRSFIKDNWLFYLGYFILIIWATYFLLNYNKVDIHLKINSLVGNKVIDTFYMYFTHAGDGLFALFVALIIALDNARSGIYILLSYAISGGLSTLMKNYFTNEMRPHLVFDEVVNIDIKYVEGVDILSSNSFPSGHSTTAFAVFTCLALLSENRWMKLLYLVMAANVAFSRTYISQHWLIDIYTGAWLGIIAATGLYFIFINSSEFSNKLNKPLLSFLK